MEDRKYFVEGLKRVQGNCADWCLSKGFTHPTTLNRETIESVQAKLMKAVSELGEACEATRVLDFNNFKEELADTMIRIINIAEFMGIDLAEEIEKKMLINEGREHLHGKVN